MDESHEWDDYYRHSSVMFVTTDKDSALRKFSELRKFCEKADDRKYLYEYSLFEWHSEDSCTLLDRCDNIKEE